MWNVDNLHTCSHALARHDNFMHIKRNRGGRNVDGPVLLLVCFWFFEAYLKVYNIFTPPLNVFYVVGMCFSFADFKMWAGYWSCGPMQKEVKRCKKSCLASWRAQQRIMLRLLDWSRYVSVWLFVLLQQIKGWGSHTHLLPALPVGHCLASPRGGESPAPPHHPHQTPFIKPTI